MNIVKNESAVSPVIGTILLVAIAVVLVAIILVVVMGFSGDTNEKKVGLNAQSESGANATLILYGGASVPELVRLEMIDQGSPYGEYVKLWDIKEGEAFVGIPYLAEKVAQPENDLDVYDTRINVRGTFSDGTDVILLVQPMTFYDVARSAKAPNQPVVNKPTVPSAQITFTSAVIQVSYENMTSVPNDRGVYYQPVKGGDAKYQSIGGGGDLNGSFSVTLNDILHPDTEYYVWGIVETSSGTVTGKEKETFTTSKPALILTKITGTPNTIMDRLGIQVSYTYTNDSTVSSGRVYYRLAGTNDAYQSVPVDFVTNDRGRYYVDIRDLRHNTSYEIYGEITTETGTYNGTSVTGVSAKVGSSVNNAPTLYFYNGGTTLPLRLRMIPCETAWKERQSWFYYRIAESGDEPQRVAGWPYSVQDNSGSIPGLTYGIKYEVWGSIVLLNGEEVRGPSAYFTPYPHE